MPQKLFDPHARILHDGQYEIKKTAIEVPIKEFDAENALERNVQERITAMRFEIEELEAQIREKRRISEDKADKILAQVQDEAKKVLEDAEQHAFNRVQKSVQEKETVLQQASQEVEMIKSKAFREADEIREDAKNDSVKIKDIAQKEGYTDGVQQGIEATQKEVDFAIERLHSIIAETARERERILVHSETQVINLVLTMVKKVVKKLTAEHQDVVIENVKSALELLRGAMTIFIHVSPLDFNYVSSFKEEFVRKIERRADLKFIEDPTVEPGGVYIETDTGDVDVTIRSQLEELENQMRFYMPVKVKSPEIKRREQENSESLLKEQEDKVQQEEREHLPKTDFAQREEYNSKTEIDSESNKIDKSEAPINKKSPEEDVLSSVKVEESNSVESSQEDTMSSVKTVDSTDDIIDAEVVDPINTEAINSYKENLEEVTPQEPHDDITI